MRNVTVFCVQTYCQVGSRMEMGPLRQYESAREAEHVAEGLSRRVSGVMVYAVTGNPEFDAWGEPELFAAFGVALGLAA